MKTRKWLWWTLTIILTLVVLGFTGLAGYRVGFIQGTGLTRTDLRVRNMDGKTLPERPVPQDWKGSERRESRNFPGQNFGPGPGFEGRKFNRLDGRGGFPGLPFLIPLFGLVRLAVLVLLIWMGYKLVTNSGWRLTRVTAEPAPTPKKGVKKG